MQTNKYALFCLWATGPVSAYQRAGTMQAAENSARFLGYVPSMESLMMPSKRFLETREHARFLSGNIENILK